MSSRPNPFQWIAYVYGAKLPDSKLDWVYNDLTGRTATVRHLFRAQVAFLPVYLILFFAFPGDAGLRALMVLLGASLAFIFSISYMDQNRARRLQKHGLGASPKTQKQLKEAETAKQEYESIYLERRAALAAEQERLTL